MQYLEILKLTFPQSFINGKGPTCYREPCGLCLMFHHLDKFVSQYSFMCNQHPPSILVTPRHSLELKTIMTVERTLRHFDPQKPNDLFVQFIIINYKYGILLLCIFYCMVQSPIILTQTSFLKYPSKTKFVYYVLYNCIP